MNLLESSFWAHNLNQSSKVYVKVWISVKNRSIKRPQVE